MIKSVKKCIFIAIMSSIVFVPCLTFAEWKGPYDVITGTWGKAEGQFYFRAEDTADSFPRMFGVDQDGLIIISDEGNKRIVIYNSNGSLRTIIKKPAQLPEEDATYGWPSGFFVCNKGNVIIVPCEYEKVQGGIRPLKKCLLNYKGEILSKVDMAQVFSNENGFIILKNNIYYRYSATGQPLETYKEKPLELGVVDTNKINRKQYRITIKYPDKTYQFMAKRSESRHFRDEYNNLYWVEKFLEKVNKEDIFSYRVFICNACDDNVSLFNMPQSQYEPRPSNTKDYPTWSPVPIIEYGEPIASPAGNIYCWARSKTEYKILKWTWQGEPDAPQSLKVNPDKESLILTWKKPVEGVATVTAYEIYRSSDVCGPFNKIDKVKKGILQYTDKKVKEGETYYYQVCAARGSGYSGYSNKAVGSVKD